MDLEPLELETPNTVAPRQSLTLADLGHDADRDRPTHLLMAGYDDTVPQRAIAAPSSSRRFGRVTADGTRTCVSSASQSPRGRVTQVTTTTRSGSRAADPTRPSDHRTRTLTRRPRPAISRPSPRTTTEV